MVWVYMLIIRRVSTDSTDTLSENHANIIAAGDEKVNDVFGRNYPRLQKLKAQYDPTNIFNKMHPIEPAA